MYNFKEQNDIGKIGEKLIKNFYHSQNKQYVARDALMEEQMKGSDLFVVDGHLNTRYVEVKTDTKAYDTDNVAFEVYIQHEDGKVTIGAAMKTFSDFLFYWIFPTTRVLYWQPKDINPYIIKWLETEKLVDVENKKFFSRNLIVPKSTVLDTGVVNELHLDYGMVEDVLQGVDGISAVLV